MLLILRKYSNICEEMNGKRKEEEERQRETGRGQLGA
jgi:hypothetical protein